MSKTALASNANKRALGNNQEEAAVAYLKEAGYQIIARNYQIRGGEIDIIAQDGETLCFVEVRSRRSTNLGHPLESVTRSKQMHLIRAARHYLMAHPGLDCPMRFDVIGIVLNPYSITLVKNAFYAE